MMHILPHAQYGMQFGLARFWIDGIRIIEGLLYSLYWIDPYFKMAVVEQQQPILI